MRLVILGLVLLAMPVQAQKVWYYPGELAKAFVNPYLTPGRALQGDWTDRFDGQLVFWQGRAQAVRPTPPQRLQLETSAGKLEVQFTREVKNLQGDREGATVAVKGHLRRTPAGTIYLEGRSVVPWRPAGGFAHGQCLVEQWVDFSRPELSNETRAKVVRSLKRAASEAGVDPLFLTALVQIESGFDPEAVSVSGALGLGQLMPFTAAELGVNPHDIEDNLRGSARMIGGLLQRYEHRPDGKALALASYNAGPNLVSRIQRVPSYEQTINYVYFIGSLYESLKRSL